MRFIINRKVFISMLFIGMTLLGYISYKQLPVELMPDSSLPQLFVQITSRQEVDPNYMENQAVIPVEGAVGTIEGVEEINTWLNNRQASIQISFKKNINFKYLYLKMQEKIDQVRATLPTGFTVTVARVDAQQLTNQFMELQIRGSGGTDRIRNIVDQEVTNEMTNIDGIASVNVYGGKERSIEVTIDKAACDAYHITPFQIASALNTNSLNRTFAGYLHESNKQYFVHITAEYQDVKDIENIVVAKGPIFLKDVADVYFGVKEETTLSRVNGLDAISMLLVSDSQANLIDLSHRTQAIIAKLNEKLAAKDVELFVQTNLADTMEKNINQIISLALIGGLLAVFVLWIFLKNLKLVGIMALAIPVSVFTAFNLFYAFGISINSLTLVGMAMAVGMLVDNSVVVLENIYRLSGKKYHPDRAVIQGTTEVWRSVVAATLTTITVFLPFIFSTNQMIRLLGSHIGISIVSTIVISAIVALILIPMLAHTLLKGKSSHSIFYEKVTTNNRIIQIYFVLLKSAMRNPAQTVIGALIVFFVSIFIVTAISVNNLKEVDQSTFSIYVTMPTGSTLESTDIVVKELESRLPEVKEIKEYTSKIQAEEAIVTVNLKEDYEKIAKRKVAEIKADVESRVTNIRRAEISLTQPTSSQSFRNAGGGGGAGMSGDFGRFMGIGTNQEQIIIKGQDFSVMRGVAEDLRYFLDELESIRSVNVSSSSNRPEIHLMFNQRLMTEYGVTLNNISSELNSFSREYSTGVTFKQGTEEYDIILKEKGAEEKENTDKTIEDLKSLKISNSAGATYDLQDLCEIVYASGMANITRVNQEKQIEVNYRFVAEAEQSKDLLTAYRMEIDNIVSEYNLPSGVAVQVVHEEDQFKDFYFLIAAAFILILMILAAVFESLTTPFVLVFSIPLAAIGSFIALIITGNSLFNANTLTGFIILLGVVVNNGIILIDFTNILRKRGHRKSRALMEAGLSRVRPILITATTTIVAMFPLALGNAEYVGAIGAPFAITVIGGLSLSTLLTLVFIPTLYAGLENSLNWMRQLNWKIKALHLAIFLISIWYIFFRIDTFIWQLLTFLLVILLIPGVTWFIQNSLRMASTKLIGDDEPIKIEIRKLVKIYERDSRFIREWKSGIKIREMAGLTRDYTQPRDFYDLIWQIPLSGALIWFTFFYQKSNFWMLIVSVFLFFFLFVLWQPLSALLLNRYNKTGKEKLMKIRKWGYNLLLWGVPVVFLFIFLNKWDNVGLVIFVGIFIFLLLATYVSSEYVHNKNVNIERITGRFGTLRRAYFRIVKEIPIIGKRKKPFKALNGVSMDIATGMFGLLGPNGAGKSTIMRIITGIFDQSYGKIYINGLDTQKYREELQGLIGYLPQEFGTYENMTAWEFLDYQAILKGISDNTVRTERLEYVLKSVHMYDRRNENIGSYSGGMKQRIGIAHILLTLPRIMVVDEPTAGLDPRERIRFRNLLVELSRDRIVIFSTHIIEDISSSCNQVAVINKGKLKYYGNPQDMVNLGDGFVWQFIMTPEEFEEFPNKQLITNHLRDGEKIKVRAVSKEKPVPDAVNVQGHLEDAYLCLLRDIS
jgi:multidrug efflux pump subunit AcrB/ABC-type multidrug transport system ATPase subunit